MPQNLAALHRETCRRFGPAVALRFKRFGRYQPVELRTALDLGPVPDFTGRQCADCGRRWGLQYDHVEPVANHGPTSDTNIQARCWPCQSAVSKRCLARADSVRNRR